MDNNNKEEKRVLTGREEKEKISKERDKVAMAEHTILAYCSNREEGKENNDNKKKELKRGLPTRGL
ncbi:hypothetical protein L6259_01960 [Candidatus Parcubacteria bacterium]|nr:hypothetical protein [Candidatus Parcubacteria bacterium]